LSKVTSYGGQEEESNTPSSYRSSAPSHPHSLKLLLSLAPQVPHQPLRGEGILWWHPPAHHSIKESLPLTGIESQHLRWGKEAGAMDDWGLKS
jgi:hypothetical protein